MPQEYEYTDLNSSILVTVAPEGQAGLSETLNKQKDASRVRVHRPELFNPGNEGQAGLSETLNKQKDASRVRVHRPELFPDWTHAEHDMHVGSYTIDEEAEDSLSVVLYPLFTANVGQGGLDLQQVKSPLCTTQKISEDG